MTVFYGMGKPVRAPQRESTTWEGGFREPCVVRWPEVIKPGSIINDIMSQEDWVPTLLGAALVFFLFWKNDDEEKLLAQYHAEDTLPNNSGKRTADHIPS
jgi:arylsulfatase A-like enzyme